MKKTAKWKVEFEVWQTHTVELLFSDNDLRVEVQEKIEWLDEHIKNRKLKIKRIKCEH